MSEITPFSNIIQYIPKDSPYSEKGQIYPADHYAITSTEISAIESGQGGAPSELVDPNNTPSSGGAGGGVSLDNLVPLIVDYGPTSDEIIKANEPTTFEYTLTAFAGVKNLNVALLEYQWEKQESGSTTWSSISGATSTSYILPTGLNATNDSGDAYRCKISHPGAINTPVYTSTWTLNLRRTITITINPISPPNLNQGDTATLNITATITSGTISYQWQKRDSDSANFVDIPGATSSSYTTNPLFFSVDTGDEYRCVLSNSYADTVISNSTEIFVIGSDIKVEPAVDGITFWSFKDHGSLILDPSDSTTYNLTNISSTRTKLPLVMWGQGTCAAQGGYTEGAIPVEFQDTYTVKLNTGGGSAGASDSGRYAEPGGGYAGIFEGSTVSQSTALMIAGGAGGASLNTATCGNSQASIGYPVTVSYTGTCYDTVSNSSCISHSFNNTTCSNNYLYHGFQNVITTGCGTRQYYIFFSNSFQNSDYYLNIYGISSCTAGGGGQCPGFYYSVQKYSSFIVLQFYRNDNGANSYVSSFCVYASASYPYSCTQYTTNTYYHDGKAPSYGGDGGGSTAGSGDSGSESLISATGGSGGSQSSGGSSGTTTSGGSTNGSAGSSLQGGSGGDNSGSYAAAGGGGGGGGYYGGGGGAGGYDGGNVTASSGIGPQSGGGGGGGSGYIDAIVTNGSTGTYSNALDPDRGTAGDNQQNSRLVVKASYIDITSQPTSVAITEGSSATFTVEATLETYFSDITISYQWQKKSSGSLLWSNISGATSSSYTTGNLNITNNNDSYRCILTNQYTENVISNEVITLVSSPTTSSYSIETPGQYTIPVPSGAQSFTFKIWGAGGSGSGEGSVRRGGSGGFATGIISVPSGNTNDISVFVGATANGGPPNPNLGYGYGADAGGARTSIIFGSQEVIVGGGGGAGQGGHGGYGGGANRSGGSGTGSYAGGGASTSGGGGGGSSNDRPGGSGTTGSYGGGTGGGTGQDLGRRGGGGGSGYYGGGGGGGGYSNYDGSGGGGGSGYATAGVTSLVTTDGSTGTSSGASAPNSSDPDYVSGHGGSSQPGLAIIQFDIVSSEVEFTIPSTYSWTCPSGVTSISVVCVGAGGKGGGGGGGGGGLGWKNNISVTPGQTYTVVVGAPGTNTSNGGDSYFISTSTVLGGGGRSATSNLGLTNTAGGTYTGDGGGNGGSGSVQTTWGGGGGGAGGYSGNGGNANTLYGSSGSGGGGGGGAGHSNTDSNDGKRKGGGGGGVGIYGQGGNGSGASNSSYGGDGGGGGSGGTNGIQSGVHNGGTGGSYGGGSGGTNDTTGSFSGQPGGGAVRIIWGTGRSFPNNAS